MGIRVGIDLGTTFSAVAWVNPKTRQPEIIKSDADSDSMITPSEIWFAPDGKVYCGARAKEAFESGESGVANTFKRFMGTDEVCFMAPDGREYRAEELSAILLAHLKQQAEKNSGQKIDEAVITVPAYFENGPRESTRQAARQAGLNVRDIISEPTAAALNYGLGHWRENALIMVYDLGGGTFDVTLVGMKNNMLTTLGTTGDHQRGGRDWDAELARLVLAKVEQELGMSLADELEVINDIQTQAETWKKQLTTLQTLNLRIRVPGVGTANVTVTREEFETATEALLYQTVSLCDSLLGDLKVGWDKITDVLLVGGSTRMPQVAELLKKKLGGRSPIAHVNPDHAVAMGAAMMANIQNKAEVVDLSKGATATEVVEKRTSKLLESLNRNVQSSRTVELSQMVFQDAVAHAMGIVLVNEAQTEYINETIIPANAPVPCKFSRPTRFDSLESEMEIYVLQGAGSIRDAKVNAKYVVSGITRVPERMCVMHVQYSYDRNHMIHVQARQDDGQYDLPIRKEAFTQEDIDKFMLPYEPPETKTVRDPLCVVMALDVSGSMSGRPINNAKNAMLDFTYKFEDTDVSFGVLLVSDRCKWKVRPTSDLRAVRRAIQDIKECETGVCNAAHPFDEVLSELKFVSAVRYAVVLADGMWERQDLAIQQAKKCHAAGIEVVGMGFGSADKRFIQAISTQEGIMTTDSQLSASFGKIAQSITGGQTGGFAEAAPKGLRGLFGKKAASNIPQPRTWETPFD